MVCDAVFFAGERSDNLGIVHQEDRQQARPVAKVLRTVVADEEIRQIKQYHKKYRY